MKIRLSVLLSLSFAAALAQTPASIVEVHRIFQNKCVSCHGGSTPAAGLDLQGAGTTELSRAQNMASRLVNINPVNTYALSAGQKRVYPGRPDRSFLFKKINAGLEPTIPALVAQEGTVMPGNGGMLTDAEKELVRQWILYGAKTLGTQFDKSLVDQFYTSGGETSFPLGVPPAPPAGEGFQIKMGPFFLPPSGEVEYFQKYELGLPANVEVNRMDFEFSPYSHHFIIYNFTGSGASSIPAGLRTSANHSQINLVAAVQESFTLDLPQNTAFFWDKNIVLDLNTHYINYSALKPFRAEAYVNVYTQAPGTAGQQMFATLLVNPNIPIPNTGDLITHTRSEYQTGADSIYIWGLMGHTHKYGQGYKVWKRQPNGQKGELLYDASCPDGEPGCVAPWFDYRHIPMRYWEPLMPLKWGNGLIHEAKWMNDGPASVNFGPTSDDEMMVLIAFYTEEPVQSVSAVKEEDIQGDIRLSPNPAGELLRVEIPGDRDWPDLRVFDLTGREVLSRHSLSGGVALVDVSALVPGVYIIQAGGVARKVVVE